MNPTTAVNLALLSLCMVTFALGGVVMLRYWLQEGSSRVAYIHLTVTVLLWWVLLGSWGTLLGSPDVAIISRDHAAFLGAVGRGALLLLSIYTPLLWAKGLPRQRKG